MKSLLLSFRASLSALGILIALAPSQSFAAPLSGLAPADVLVVTGPGGHTLSSDNLIEKLEKNGVRYAVFDFSALNEGWTFEDTLRMLETDPQAATQFYDDYYKLAETVSRPGELPQGAAHDPEKFLGVLNVVQPKMILSTYALAMETIDRLKMEKKFDGIPVALVPTDYHLNPYWTKIIPMPADIVFAPSQAWKDAAVANGTPAEKVIVSGLPANPRAEVLLTPEQSDALWRELGLDPAITTVFLSGGNGGVGSFGEMLESISSAFNGRPEKKVQLVFAVGRSDKARAQVEAAMRAGVPANVKVKVLGFDPNLPNYMNVMADIVVSKAGGLTTTEVARSKGYRNGKLREGRPFLITMPAYGVEPGNTEYFFKREMASPTLVGTLGKDILEFMDNPARQLEVMTAQGEIRKEYQPKRITAWLFDKLRTLTGQSIRLGHGDVDWVATKLAQSRDKGSKPMLRFSYLRNEAILDPIRAQAEEIKMQRLEVVKKLYPATHAKFGTTAFDMSVTFDDFPVGITPDFKDGERIAAARKIIDVLKGHGIHDATAFVSADGIEGWFEAREILLEWLKAGFKLGNTAPTGDRNFIEEVEKNDRFLKDLGLDEASRRVIRLPDPENGETAEERATIRRYLSENGYRIAPKTVDADSASDPLISLRAARASARKVFGAEVPQISGLLLSRAAPELLHGLLSAYEREGARFISLERSLQDPRLAIDPGQTTAEPRSHFEELEQAIASGSSDQVRANVRAASDAGLGAKVIRLRDRKRKAEAPIHMAVTVDDLPHGIGMQDQATRERVLRQLIDVLKAHGVKDAYAFVNSEHVEKDPGSEALLKMWLGAGYKLGNHTHSHGGASKMSSADFIADIEKTDKYLEKLGVDVKTRRVFRFPFLQEGNTPEKRVEIQRYLNEKGYVQAPVTVDTFDWRVNDEIEKAASDQAKREIILDGAAKTMDQLRDAQEKAKELFGRDIEHVLLLHLSPSTPALMEPVLSEFGKAGVRYIETEEALTDPAYAVDHGQVAYWMANHLQNLYSATGRWTPEPQSLFDPEKVERELKAIRDSARALTQARKRELRSAMER